MSSSSQFDNSPIRIGIVSVHPVIRAGLKHMLTQSNMVITTEASSIDEAVTRMSQQPREREVVIIDPDADEVTLHAITQLIEIGIDRMLVLTSTTDPKVHQRAFEMGALGVVLKDQPAETLIQAIRKVHAGEAWLERVQTANLLNAIRRLRDPEEVRIESLTKREREVIELVGQGLNSARISECLFISEATVRNHLTSILGKLGLTNRFELAVYAFRHRLVELTPSTAASGRATATAPGHPSVRRAAI